MIQNGTILQVGRCLRVHTLNISSPWLADADFAQRQVSDNSGAKTAQCINQSGRSWGIGDIITVAVKSAVVRGARRCFAAPYLWPPSLPVKHAGVGAARRQGRRRHRAKGGDSGN